MKFSKHIALITLTGSLVSMAILFGFANNTNAAVAGVTQCLSGIMSGKAQAQASSGSGSAMTVPVNSRAANTITGNVSGQTQGSTITRCIVEPLIITAARALLENFTAQTIKWINSGFKGSPLYVTNIQGFLTDVADQAAGQFIEGLGPIGKILCSPFDFQLRISLGIQYSQSDYYQKIGCRLSDIQRNVQRAFTTGIFGKNGWDNWLTITASPQNNPYGAYLEAVNAIDFKIANTQYTLKTQLDFGKGFLSATDKDGNITTPGSLIEDQLSNTMGERVRQVGLAKDIDAIVNALFSELIGQVLGPGGLGSIGGGNRTGSYTTSVHEYTTRLIEANRQAQNLPVGLSIETGFSGVPRTSANVIRIGPTGPTSTATPTVRPMDFCGQFRKNIYGTDLPAGTPPTDTTPVLVKVNGTTDTAITPINTYKTGGVPWTTAEYNHVATFCQTAYVSTTIDDEATDFNDSLDDGVIVDDTPTFNPEQNLALLPSASAKQSSTYLDWAYYPEAKLAINGQTTGNTSYGLALTQAYNHSWWQLDLGANKNIKTIKIYRTPTGAYLNYQFYIFVTTDDMGGTLPATLVNDNTGKVIKKIVVNNPSTVFGTTGGNVAVFDVGNISGRYILIAKNQPSTYLGLAEVEVFPAPPNAGNADGGTTITDPISFSQQASGVKTLNGPGASFKDEFFLVANKDLNGVRFTLRLRKTTESKNAILPVSFEKFTINSPFIGNTTLDIVTKPDSVNIVNPALSVIGDNLINIKNNITFKKNDNIKIELEGITSSTMNRGTYQAFVEIWDATGLIATHTTNLQLGEAPIITPPEIGGGENNGCGADMPNCIEP